MLAIVCPARPIKNRRLFPASCPPWTRTTMTASKVRRPALRRAGNVRARRMATLATAAKPRGVLSPPAALRAEGWSRTSDQRFTKPPLCRLSYFGVVPDCCSWRQAAYGLCAASQARGFPKEPRTAPARAGLRVAESHGPKRIMSPPETTCLPPASSSKWTV